jgi:hypothetical protein
MPLSVLARRYRHSATAAVVPINPTSLSWELLLDSRNIVPIANNAPIPGWPDASGNARDAGPVPGFNPLYKTASSPTGQPLADFNAANTQMTGALPGGGVGNGSGFSFYAYYILDSAAKTGGGDSQIILGDDQANGFRLFGLSFQSAGDGRPSFTTSTTVLGSVQATTGGSHILTCICAPPSGSGAANLYLDGTLIGTGTWAANPATTYLVSGNAVQNVWLRGRLGFAGLGRRADSDLTRQGVELFLRNTFG